MVQLAYKGKQKENPVTNTGHSVLNRFNGSANTSKYSHKVRHIIIAQHQPYKCYKKKLLGAIASYK